MKHKPEFLEWERDEDVHGYAAAYMPSPSRLLDLTVTVPEAAHVPVSWDVVDACTVIAHGLAETVGEAKAAAEYAARTQFVHAA